MKKNMKKVIRWIKEGRPVTDETHPVNFPRVAAKLEAKK